MTRKHILIIIAILYSLCSYAQTTYGTWNDRTATYSNSKYGITWTLISGFNWVQAPIHTSDTIFQVKEEDVGIMVTLTVDYVGNEEGDIWDVISFYTRDSYINLIRNEAKRNDMVLRNIKPTRSCVSGKSSGRFI